MVNITITNEKVNKILHRREIEFEIEHLGSGTPNRLEVRDKLAAMKTAKPDLTFVIQMNPRFGSPLVRGSATIYEDAAMAKRLEPNFVEIRNMPKDLRNDAWKAIREKHKKKKKAT